MKKFLFLIIVCLLYGCGSTSKCVVTNKEKIPQQVVKNTVLTITMPQLHNDTVRKDTTYIIPSKYVVNCKCGEQVYITKQQFDSINIGDVIVK